MHYLDQLKLKISELNGRTFEPKDILRIAFFCLCLNLLIAIFNGLIGLQYPYSTFLIWPTERFGDLFRGVDGFGIVDTWEGIQNDFKYFEHLLPLSATCYFIIAKLIFLLGNKYVTLFLVYLIAIEFIIQISKKSGNTNRIILLALFSYPMIFAMDRGNIAIFVFLLLLFALTTDNIVLSTLAIAVATSMKITPVIFIVPVLLSRQLSLKWVVSSVLLLFAWIGIVNFLVIQFNGNFIPPRVFDLNVLLSGPLNSYDKNHVSSMQGLGFGSSLFMPLLYLATKFHFPVEIKSHVVAFIVYLVIGACLFAKKDIIPTFHRMLERKNMLFVTCISFVLLMPVTGDYYLLVLLIPLLVYPKTTFSFGYLLMYGLLLGPKNIFFLKPTDFLGNIDISLQVFINPILLLLLLFGEFLLIPSIKRDQLSGASTIWSDLQNFGKKLFWLSSLIAARRKKLYVILSIALLGWITTIQILVYQQKIHNKEIGLPPDFDPKTYLEINPGLEQFWTSKGIKHKSKKALLEHAEIHYRDFGAKENWKYK